MALFRRKKELPIRQPHITSQNESYSFRRSRTLTGSRADSVRTVGENRAQIKSPRIHAHELRQHRRKLSLYLVGVIVIIGAGWTLISQFTGSIDKIMTTPVNPTISTAQYDQLIQKYFATHPMERFRFALLPDRLHEYLADEAPEIKSVQLTDATRPGESDMSITFREPVVVWEISRQKYYVDAEGYTFARNYYAEPVVTVKDESGINPSTGAVASNRFLYFLGRVVALMNQSGIATVSGVIIPPNTTREVDLKLTGKSYVVKTLLDRDPAQQVSDIINTVKYVDAKAISPQYLDVRIGGKAFYR